MATNTDLFRGGSSVQHCLFFFFWMWQTNVTCVIHSSHVFSIVIRWSHTPLHIGCYNNRIASHHCPPLHGSSKRGNEVFMIICWNEVLTIGKDVLDDFILNNSHHG